MTEPSSWTKKALTFLSRGEGSFVIGDALLISQAIQITHSTSSLRKFFCSALKTPTTFVLLHAEALPPSTRRVLRQQLPRLIFLRDSALINSSRSPQLFLQTFYDSIFEALCEFPTTHVSILTKNMANTHYVLQQLHEAQLVFDLNAIDECMCVSFTSKSPL